MRPRLFLLVALLFAVAGCSSTDATAPAKRRYVVSAFGAVGDGTTVNTRALQALIDRAAADGGGVVVVPQGTFISGALFFKPGVDLVIERGGILKSTTSMTDFPPIYTRWEGIERYWTAAFLNFVGLDHVRVSGEGTIDGSGDAWAGFGKLPRPMIRHRTRGETADESRAPAPPAPSLADAYPTGAPSTGVLAFAPDPQHLPAINAAGVVLPRQFGTLSPPRAIVFQNCQDVRISGLTLKNEARWGYVFVYCADVVAEKLTARAEHYIPSSDGMDIDSCRRVLVTGCDLDCNDDCISIKSGKDEDGRRVNRPSEDIVIEKTRFAYGHGGAAVGSETSGGIRRVEVRDCVAEAGNWAPIRIKTQPSRGGVIEDITYRNLELRGVKQAVEITLEWNMRINIAGDQRMPPVVRGVKLIGIRGTAETVGYIHGLPDRSVGDVTFSGCDLTANTGLKIDHADQVDTRGLTLQIAHGEPIVRR